MALSLQIFLGVSFRRGVGLGSLHRRFQLLQGEQLLGRGPQPGAPELFLLVAFEHVVGLGGQGAAGQADGFGPVLWPLGPQARRQGQGGFGRIRFDLEHPPPATQGRSPVLASRLRDKLAAALPADLEERVERLSAERDRIHAEGGSTEVVDWSSFVDDL